MQRIVFVEDDAELGALIKNFLGKHDLDVTLVPRGDTAMAIILQEKPDLVLLDIMLPGIDGLTLCRNLHPQYAGPIVMLTSLDSDMNHILGLELGASDYILKTPPPFRVTGAVTGPVTSTSAGSTYGGKHSTVG